MKRVGTKKSGERGRPARCVVRLAQHILKRDIAGMLFGEASKRASEALALPSPEHA
jgi:hypothetical protein